tara:strand:+ start:880 stop:1347 length:468 start_codon:yes stop_codon:yes gene_type:complete
MTTDAFTIAGKMALPYQYFAGATSSRCIVALRDEKKILASRCERSDRTVFPPRQVCDLTFEDLSDNWVEVSDRGTITGFTIIRYAEPYQPMAPPYVLALIRLDGSDATLTHIVHSEDIETVAIGQRVNAVFAETPVNNILAIRHFCCVPTDSDSP